LCIGPWSYAFMEARKTADRIGKCKRSQSHPTATKRFSLLRCASAIERNNRWSAIATPCSFLEIAGDDSPNSRLHRKRLNKRSRFASICVHMMPWSRLWCGGNVFETHEHAGDLDKHNRVCCQSLHYSSLLPANAGRACLTPAFIWPNSQTERNQVARIAAGRFYLNLNRAALRFALHPRMFSCLARIAMPCLPATSLLP